MENTTLMIIQCVGFILLILAVFYYFNKKMLYQLNAIESLQNQVLEQQKFIERHDNILRQIYGSMPNTYQPSHPPTVPSTISPSHHPTVPSIPPTISPSHSQTVSQQQTMRNNISPPLANPLLNMAPMVNTLLGALNTFQSVNNEEEDKPIINEKELNDELKNELEELKKATPDIHEGRVDESEIITDRSIENS
jgi:uncharacterized coiled-coil protein SlyX